ncbi:MAG: type II toxin-antitoxin system HicA family toxin [Nitrososphaerales archaeon]
MKNTCKTSFESRHTKGSHVFLKHSDGRTTTVPVHAGEAIDR